MNAKNTTKSTEPKAQTGNRHPMQVRTGLRAGDWLLTTAGQ